MENLRWKKELHSNSFQIYYLFFLSFFGNSLSTTNSQLALTCRRGASPFAHWCSIQTHDHLKRRVSGRVAVELCIMACSVQLEGMSGYCSRYVG